MGGGPHPLGAGSRAATKYKKGLPRGVAREAASFTGPEGYFIRSFVIPYCGVTLSRTKILASPVGRVYSTDVPLSTTPTVWAVHVARSGEVSTA